MNSMGVDVKNLLVTAGAGYDAVLYPAADWAIFLNAMPDKPHNLIYVADTGGENSHYINKSNPAEKTSCQVKVRGFDATITEAQAWKVYEVLKHVGYFMASRPKQPTASGYPLDNSSLSYEYADLWANQTPRKTEIDGAKRHVYTFNIQALRRRLT